MKLKNLIWLLAFLPQAMSAAWSDSEYLQIEQHIRQPQFAEKEFNILDYKANANASAAENQEAINSAIKACSEAGGGKVIVSGGTYHTGAIRLMSHVNLVIEKGATVEFVFDPTLYPIVPTRWEGVDCWNLSPCIYAYQATDVAITGEGIVDGGGSQDTWWKWSGVKRFGWTPGDISQAVGRPKLLSMAEDGVTLSERKFTIADGLRPQLINFNQCDGVLLENITLLRSPFWAVHPLLSKNVTLRGVHINNDAPNGDGCDPESCDGVLIENCYFNTGDDCIAIKGGRNNDGRLWDKPSQNIIVRNCEMQNGHGGVSMGSEISGGCRNIFITDCKMDSPNLKRVMRIKSNTCRGGVIEGINMKNVTVGQCKESVMEIELNYDQNEKCNRGFFPLIHNVTLENVTCEKSEYGLLINALDNAISVYNINIINCRFNNVIKGNSIEGMVEDLRFNGYYINGLPCFAGESGL